MMWMLSASSRSRWVRRVRASVGCGDGGGDTENLLMMAGRWSEARALDRPLPEFPSRIGTKTGCVVGKLRGDPVAGGLAQHRLVDAAREEIALDRRHRAAGAGREHWPGNA